MANLEQEKTMSESADNRPSLSRRSFIKLGGATVSAAAALVLPDAARAFAKEAVRTVELEDLNIEADRAILEHYPQVVKVKRLIAEPQEGFTLNQVVTHIVGDEEVPGGNLNVATLRQGDRTLCQAHRAVVLEGGVVLGMAAIEQANVKGRRMIDVGPADIRIPTIKQFRPYEPKLLDLTRREVAPIEHEPYTTDTLIKHRSIVAATATNPADGRPSMTFAFGTGENVSTVTYGLTPRASTVTAEMVPDTEGFTVGNLGNELWLNRAGGSLLIRTDQKEDAAKIGNPTFRYAEGVDATQMDARLHDLTTRSFASAMGLDASKSLNELEAEVKDRTLKMRVAAVDNAGEFQSLNVPWGGFEERDVKPGPVRVEVVPGNQGEVKGYPVNFEINSAQANFKGTVGVALGATAEGQLCARVGVDDSLIETMGSGPVKNFALGMALARLAQREAWNGQPREQLADSKKFGVVYNSLFVPDGANGAYSKPFA